MKKIMLMAAAALFVLPALAQNYDPKVPIQTKSLSGNNIEQVNAETSGGNILVEGVSDAEARIEVYVWADNSRDRHLTKEELQNRLSENYELSMTVSGHTLKAVARPKSSSSFNDRRSLGISFRIYVPAGASSDLRTSGGNIAVKALKGGRQDFTTSGGNISVDGVEGKIKGSTSGGNIHLARSSKDIDLTTSGGNIAAEESLGNIRLSTSGGNISLDDLNGDIDARTSGGSVAAKNIEGSLSAKSSGGNLSLSGLSCSLDASTASGNISVSMRKLVDYLTLSNSGGNTVLSIPANAAVNLQLHARKVQLIPKDNFSGSSDDEHVEGKLNGGGIPIRVDGGGGQIALELR